MLPEFDFLDKPLKHCCQPYKQSVQVNQLSFLCTNFYTLGKFKIVFFQKTV